MEDIPGTEAGTTARQEQGAGRFLNLKHGSGNESKPVAEVTATLDRLPIRYHGNI